MGCRILYDGDAEVACLYDSVTETAFGPLFHGVFHQDARDVAEAFCKRLGAGPRIATVQELIDIHAEFYKLANEDRDFIPRILNPKDYQ